MGTFQQILEQAPAEAWERGGVAVAAEPLARHYYPYVEAFARLQGLVEHDTYEVVQDTILLIYKEDGYHPKPGGPPRPSAWLRGVVRGLARNHKRNTANHDFVVTPTEDLDQFEDENPRTVTQKILRAQAWRQLDQLLIDLVPHLRDVFLLVKVAELSYADAAEELGISENKVRMDLHKACRALDPHVAQFRELFRRDPPAKTGS